MLLEKVTILHGHSIVNEINGSEVLTLRRDFIA